MSAAVHAFLGPSWVVLLAARITRAGRREFRRRLSGPVEVRAGDGVTVVDDLPEDQLLRLLTDAGAPERCVLVKDGLLEDEVTDLAPTVHRVLLTREGALVSCIPGRLCLLQCDGGRTRAVLSAVGEEDLSADRTPTTAGRGGRVGDDGSDHGEDRR